MASYPSFSNLPERLAPMSDETLIGSEIGVAASQEHLLEPFDQGRIRGASYEIRAGRTIIIAYSDSEGGVSPIDLEVKREWSIPPGHTAILYSLERVTLPLDMKARLSLRARLATKLLLFAGGLVDPGYQGYLFLPLANLSDSPIEIRYGDPIVTAEFVRIGKQAQPYSTESFESIPHDRLPSVPPERVSDLIELTRLTSQHAALLANLAKTIEAQNPLVQANTRIVDTMTGALITGVGAGAALATILTLFTRLPDPWNWWSGAGATAIALVVGYVVRKTFLPGLQRSRHREGAAD